MVAVRRSFLPNLLLISTLLMAGCAIIPTVPHDFGYVPDKKAFANFCPGVTTLADVLLQLGEPTYRLRDDRFLMYSWAVVYGYLVFYGGFWAPIPASHYLCLEFGADALLVRSKVVEGGILEKGEAAIADCLEQPGGLDDPHKK